MSCSRKELSYPCHLITYEKECETCSRYPKNFDIEEYEKEIRAKVIDECINAIKERWIMWNVGVIKAVIDWLEQLKDNN